MLQKWSIRTTLTVVGLILVALTLVVGALGLVALSRANGSIETIAHGDLVAIRALNDASSLMLRTRVAIDRVSTLTAGGNTDEAKKVLDRAQELYGKSNENWKTFLDTPKAGIEQATLDELGTKRTALLRDGVDAELAALRASDLNAYHAIADTKISRCSSPTTTRPRRS